LTALLGILGASAGGRSAHAAESHPVRLSDAAEQGTFNVGAAQAVVSRLFDPTAGGDVLKLDYTMPRGTAVGVWAKAFPGGLNADNAEIVRLGVRAAEPEQLRHIALAVEVKGVAGIQRIPLDLHPDSILDENGSLIVEHTVDWQTIGKLTEVVVVVSRIGDAELAAGTVYLDVRFERLPLLRKLGMMPTARIVGVLLLSLLGALLTAGLQALSRRLP
jgi:hypothetical protein